MKCDVCSKESEKVLAGRWVFYCGDNPQCKEIDQKKTYENELEPALIDGEMPEGEIMELMEGYAF